jgi:mannose-6-phosphate isomerase-like protein (cupin superfamily)
MLESKITIETLPPEGDHDAERRFVSPKGEMAQILNRPDEPYYHLVYWDLDTPTSGQQRGHHYHAKKVECFYILTGKLEFMLETLDKTERLVIPVEAGQRITLQPGVAHAFRSNGYAQVLEYSPAAYDPTDTYPHPVG